ncbi:NUDIX domain-containing protein [Candidatus Gracilibacteria bacterium]|nr:NUDIX domain-containing protein [Candidatus Gracilibacteria bacterium]
MNEVVKDKMMREIMVVKNDYLFQNVERKTNFYTNDDAPFEDIILANYEYMVRGEAEQNFDYKQPIPYAVVVDEENRVFVYKRGGSDSNAGDARLHSKIAFGVGGHLEREDEDCENPLTDSLAREIEEEIAVKEESIKSIEAIGYLNEEETEVSQVHLGIAYIVRVHNTNIELLDGELENGEFIEIDELESMIHSGDYNVENWSQILFKPMKKFLSY